MTAKKMGRPTDNPKPYRIMTRLDENAYKILTEYSEKNGVTLAEGIRRAILKLDDKK